MEIAKSILEGSLKSSSIQWNETKTACHPLLTSETSNLIGLLGLLGTFFLWTFDWTTAEADSSIGRTLWPEDQQTFWGFVELT